MSPTSSRIACDGGYQLWRTGTDDSRDGMTHPGHRAQRALHLAQFDPVSADLYLMVCCGRGIRWCRRASIWPCHRFCTSGCRRARRNAAPSVAGHCDSPQRHWRHRPRIHRAPSRGSHGPTAKPPGIEHCATEPQRHGRPVRRRFADDFADGVVNGRLGRTAETGEPASRHLPGQPAGQIGAHPVATQSDGPHESPSRSPPSSRSCRACSARS